MGNPVTLNDAIKAAIDYRLNNVHTSMPAAIIAYDYATQKATVQPLLNKVWTDGTTTPFLPMESVPVIFPRAGGAGLTFPVIEGDTCLLVFIERSTDLWKTVGGQVNPDDNRKFDLSDAVAIVGLFPFNEISTADNNTDVILTYADSTIRIKQSGAIVIETASTVAIGNSTTELLSVLYQILGYLSSATAFTVPSTPFTGPFNFQASALALQTAVNAIKGTIP